MAAYNPQYRCAVVQSAYLGSVRYYAALMRARSVVVDDAMTGIPALWAHNHCRLSGANGVQQLVIPVDRADYNSRTPMRDIVVSNHGDWRHLHWGAMFSAYGKSPFFEYVADDLHRIYEHHSHWLCEFNMAIHNIVADYMQLGQLGCATIVKEPVGESAAMPKALVEAAHGSDTTEPLVYHQLWSERNGFMPHLSIFDLLFNQGNAAPVVLLSL